MDRRVRAALRGAWLVACLAAGCAGPGATTPEDIQARAATERPDPLPGEVIRPECLRQVRTADPQLAAKSIGDVEVALAPLREAAEGPAEGAPSAVVASARAAAARGELEAASRLLVDHVRTSPRDVSAWRELGRVLDAAGRRDLAGEAWTRVLALEPADPEALGSGGVDAAAARRPLQAAERLLRLRQLRRVGEAPEADLGEAMAQQVALGLSLRELGHLRAAAESLEQAAQAPLPASSAAQRQAGDLHRMAGECWEAMQAWDRAATALERALRVSGPEDRVALPRLVWVLLQGGRRWAALQAITQATAIDAPGHAGLPETVRMLRTAWPDSGVDAVLAGSTDPVVRRARWTVASLAARPPGAAPDTVVDTATVLSAILQSEGASSAVAAALAWVRVDPDAAERIAMAMRGTAAPMTRWRELLGSGTSVEADRAILLARLELAGGDPEAACRAIESVPGWRGQPALLAAALTGAGAMEDGARLRSLLPERTDDVRVAAAAAVALSAIADATQAARWAERAIEIDARNPRAWLARAVADRARVPEGDPQADPAWRSAAAISAERAWECAPGSESAARGMLELAPADADVQAELAELAVRGQGRDASRREWDRHQALRRVQQGQGEPVLETLRALLSEDPTDVPVAAALVAAAAASGELVDTEAWLERLRVRRPAAPAVVEALVSAKARQGRLTEGVQLLREASQADPSSMARRRAWARSLAVAGRHEEAWSVIAPGCQGQSGPRAALECAEQALRSGRDAVAVEMLGELARSPDLTPAQRLALMVIANRVPRSAASRRELLASGGRAAMGLPGASAQLLAAAMLGGSEADAALLARSGMRDWKAPPLLDGVQFLLDEGEAGRAGSLLLAAIDRADRSDRRSLERALCAVLCSRGEGEAAERRLQAWRASEGGSLLADGPEASEAEDLNELGGSLLIAGHREQAERIFARAIEADARLGSALNNLAWLRIERGVLDDRTGELVRRALESGPDDPSTLDTAAWWDHLRGPVAGPAGGVIERLRKATAGEAPSLESLDHLGDALWSDGRRDDAARVWRLIVEAGSGRASRERVMQAFNLMQKRLWGVRAWDAASFYDARDGVALGRAQAKLKALAEGREPPVTPRPAPPPADPAPSSDPAP